jgi:hypothetical protein
MGDDEVRGQHAHGAHLQPTHPHTQSTHTD